MNSKESFLKELQSSLAVLAESEQQDILAEYAQHIDMRMAGGLTEEEAIRDFGDIHQLTAEILAAYHVNPSYAAGSGNPVHLPNPRPALSRGLTRTGGFFRNAGHQIAALLAKAGRAILVPPRHLIRWVRSLVHRNPSQSMTEPESETLPMDSVKRPHPPVVGRANRVGRFFRQLGRGIARLIRLAAWLAWNGALLLCAVPFVCAGFLALICMGVLAVWLTQGLPLAGAALGCIGILAFCAGILGLGRGLIWHRRSPRAAAQSIEEMPSRESAAAQEDLGTKEDVQDGWE